MLREDASTEPTTQFTTAVEKKKSQTRGSVWLSYNREDIGTICDANRADT